MCGSLCVCLCGTVCAEACAEVCAEACAGGLCGRQKIHTKSAQSPHKLRTKPNPPELSGTSRNSMEQRFWNSAGLKAVSLEVVGGLAPRGPKTRDWLFHAALPSKKSSTPTTSIEVINQNSELPWEDAQGVAHKPLCTNLYAQTLRTNPLHKHPHKTHKTHKPAQTRTNLHKPAHRRNFFL